MQDPNSVLRCIHVKCRAVSHIICLAGHFLAQNRTDEAEPPLIPVDGCCPSCRKEILWGDLIRLKNGCYQNLIVSIKKINQHLRIKKKKFLNGLINCIFDLVNSIKTFIRRDSWCNSYHYRKWIWQTKFKYETTSFHSSNYSFTSSW